MPPTPALNRPPSRHGRSVRGAVALVACVLCACQTAPSGQAPSGRDLVPPPVIRRPGDVRPQLPEFGVPPRPDLHVPGVPEAVPSPPEALETVPAPARPGPSIVVRRFNFIGNTVFSDAELADITAPFVGRPITAEDLEEARNRLTQHYIDKGYVTSGAILPDQDIVDGVVTFQLIEGSLSEINIQGQQGLKEDYIRQRVRLGAGPPLNVNDLQQRFRILLQDPLIERLNGALRPGTQPGAADLDLIVARARPYSVALAIDNHEPPSTGEITGRITGVVRNLTGWGDSVDVNFARSQGTTDVQGGAALPITPRDTTVFLRGRFGDDVVVEEPLSDLDIQGDFWTVEGGVRHPVYRTPEQELALDLMFARRHSETTLLGRPFSFSPGAHEGKSDVSVVRFAQEWTDRSEQQVFAVRSTFSLGLGVLGATRNADQPDSQFLAWLGQAQVARRLTENNVQIILRADAQLANDGLLSLEQFPVGGANSVRGYRENTLVRDNGVVASVEGRLPVFDLTLPQAPAGYRGRVTLAPFADWGAAWNHNQSFADRKQINSIGVGLLWAPAPWLEGEIYWGYALRDVDLEGESLQDQGVHVRVVVRPL